MPGEQLRVPDRQGGTAFFPSTWRLVRLLRASGALATVCVALVASDVGTTVRLGLIAVLFAIGGGVLSSNSTGRTKDERFASLVGIALSLGYVLLGLVPGWAPVAVVAAVSTAPWLVGLVLDFYREFFLGWDKGSYEGASSDDRATDRHITALALWDLLWRPLTITVWLAAALVSAAPDAAVALVPVGAVLMRQRLLSVVALAAVWAAGSSSPASLAAALVVGVSLLPLVPARPPARSLGLPAVASAWRQPVGRLRLLVGDRALRHGRHEDAVRRYRAAAARYRALDEHAALREANAHLEQGEHQRALDAATELTQSSSPVVRACAYRLRGEALRDTNQLDESLQELRRASSESVKLADRARVDLALSETLAQLGRFDDASRHARRASERLDGRRNLNARIRAIRVEAGARWQSGDLNGAKVASEGVLEQVMGVRWLRRHVLRNSDDAKVAWSPGAPLLVEYIRLTALEARIELASGRDGAAAIDDLIGCRDFFGLLAMRIDAAEISGVLAEAYAERGDDQRALGHALVRLLELDRVRYTLRGPTARARWARRFSAALADGLELSSRGRDPRLQAELIELARLQSLPLLRAPDDLVDQTLLATAPTVRVRRIASIGKVVRDEGAPAPIDIERAAELAAGTGAWWFSTWMGKGSLFWSVVPPHGRIEHGRLDASEGSPLEAALQQLKQSLPVLLTGESIEEMDIRLAASPLFASPEQELRLAQTLGDLLLPQPLREALVQQHTEGAARLRLAVAAAPQLGYVPWSLLAVSERPTTDRAKTTSPRLVELADWVLAPSAGVLAAGPTAQQQTDELPLRLAVLDTTSNDRYGALPAARRLADRLGDDVTVMGGRHWSDQVATRSVVLNTLRSIGPACTVLFACHARRGSVDRPSSSALVLAGETPESTPSWLTAGDIVAFGGDKGDRSPAQVFLAACDTSDLASSIAGEWLTLAPAFIAAGTRTVVTTSFPLIDASMHPDADDVFSAVTRADDIAEAVWRTQRAGLRSWQTPAQRRRPIAQTPLVWGAYAVCASGRSSTARAEDDGRTSAKPLALVSNRGLTALAATYRLAREVHDKTVTSAHFMAAYLLDEIDYYEDALLREVAATFGFRLLAKVLRATPAVSAIEIRPSQELVSTLATAMTIADNEGSRAHPEHIVRACKLSKSRGALLYKLVGASRRSQVGGAIAANLAEARVKLGPARVISDADPREQAFLNEVLTLAAATASA
jgi:tetratricopeptide (TPR) repeat protein